MKLMRFGKTGQERPGVLTKEGVLLDVSHLVSDYNAAFFSENGLELLKEQEKKGFPEAERVPEGERWGMPVGMPSKVVCAGLNYSSHVEEFGSVRPTEPALFLVAPSACSGPFDPIIRPPHRYKLDYEVELAVVIGKRALNVNEADALKYVAGYTLMCDVSERAMQLEHGGQWTKGKSYDSFAPLGPCMVTRDEIPDVSSLHLWLTVNSEMRQRDYVSSMIWSVPQLISYTSQFMTLMPGDILSTGTPAGAGMGRGEDAFLQPGDVVEMGCELIGTSRHLVVDA